jgi:hypothetical protein
MNTIPVETVDEVWQRINDYSDDQVQELSERMKAEQPFVLMYLLASDENLYEGEERGKLLELGAIVWEVMSAGDANLRVVSGEELEEAEDANLKMLEDMSEDSDADMAGNVSAFFTDYNQMPLLGAVVEALMAGHEDDPEDAPDNIGLALLHIKTVIDCLDQ